MNKNALRIFALLLPLSLLTVACNAPSNQTEAQAPTSTESSQAKSTESTKIQLVSPSQPDQVPMGDAQLVLEVQDAKTGQPLKVEDIEVSATMPMEGEEPMSTKVEVEPDSQPGRFKVNTYFGMQGTWNVVATLKDPQHQGQEEFTLEIR